MPLFISGQLNTEGSPFATLLIIGVAGCALMTVVVADDSHVLVLSLTITWYVPVAKLLDVALT